MSDAAIAEDRSAEPESMPRRLHIGGETPRDGWEIVNVQPGPHADHLGDVQEVARTFADASQVKVASVSMSLNVIATK